MPDFPKAGIVSNIITPILQDSKLFKKVIDSFAERYRKNVDVVIGIESRDLFRRRWHTILKIVRSGPKRKLPYETVEAYDSNMALRQLKCTSMPSARPAL